MICVPIVARTQIEALRKIERSAPLTDIIELRMDMIRGGNLGELINKVRSCPSFPKIIVTNRRKGEGITQLSPGGDSNTVKLTKKISTSETQRVATLNEAVACGADYIDVELNTPDDLRRELLSAIGDYNNRTQPIISHHDFGKTPSTRRLKELFHESVKAGASVVKIVTFARSPEDNLRVLDLIPYARKSKRSIVAFCMGEEGRISRILAPLLGSFLTFASLSKGAESAAGQLTIREIREIYKILKVKMPALSEDGNVPLSQSDPQVEA
ncbi:MAG: type I 3-dehydroquinate dehydratase [Syntrophales bacterium]